MYVRFQIHLVKIKIDLKGGKMSDKKTITINKEDLWKYTTFLLIAIVLIGGFFVFINRNNGGNTKNVVVNTGSGTTAKADLSTILNNQNLYPSLGPKDAKATVIEFIDFQCPYCGMASGLVPWIAQYKNKYGDLIGSAAKVKALAKQGKIRYVVVTMSFLGQESVYAAEAGLCANEQGKFFVMDDAIYSAQTQGEDTGKFNKDKLEIIAQGVSGLNQAKFKSCLENDKTLSSVKEIAGIASQFARGTPTFYVNGKNVQASWPAIQAAINSA